MLCAWSLCALRALRGLARRDWAGFNAGSVHASCECLSGIAQDSAQTVAESRAASQPRWWQRPCPREPTLPSRGSRSASTHATESLLHAHRVYVCTGRPRRRGTIPQAAMRSWTMRLLCCTMLPLCCHYALHYVDYSEYRVLPNCARERESERASERARGREATTDGGAHRTGKERRVEGSLRWQPTGQRTDGRLHTMRDMSYCGRRMALRRRPPNES